jgi:hypothetical protein
VNQETLKKLSGISTIEGLRSAVRDLCLPHGNVKNIQLIRLDHDEGYMCFVELDSLAAYAAMTRELGGVIYGNSVAFTILAKQPGLPP